MHKSRASRKSTATPKAAPATVGVRPGSPLALNSMQKHVGMQIISKSTPEPILDPFWAQWQHDCRVLARKYGYIHALRKNKGEWIIYGDQAAVRAFRDLARTGAERLGFHGVPDSAVQFMMDHIHGDHIVREYEAPIKIQDCDFLFEHSDGTREGYIGRQRVAY